MASVRVHFSPGFPLGGGFPAEQNTHVVLCVNRIPSEQKIRFPELLCIFRIPPEQKHDSLLPGKFPSLRSSEYHRSNSLRNFLLQRALECRRRSLILLRYPPEQPLLSSCGVVPPRQSKLLFGKSSSKRKSRAKVHPDGRHFKIIRV
jgi:hypothetical protein